MTGKKYFLLFLVIGAATAAYLYYVQQYRHASLVSYFGQPKIGDIYKMEKKFGRDGKATFYLKIKDIGAESIYFYQSKMTGNGMNDVLLGHYDTTEVEVYSKKEMQDIKEGRWNNDFKDYTTLKEITRK
jgi:hypothetical protein